MKTDKPGIAEESVEHSFSQDDVRLGARAQLWVGRLSLVSVVLMLGMGIFVASQVPFDTTTTYNRLGSQFQIPIFGLSLFPVAIMSIWFKGRSDRSGRIPKSERYILITSAAVILAFSLFAQAYLAKTFLEAAVS